MKERYFILDGKQMIKFADEEDLNERGILCIKNARLKRIKMKNDKQKLWGFVIMSKGLYYKFYHFQQQIIEQWITALSKMCILLDLNMEYKQGELIGRGNFGSVYTATKMGDPETIYAIKSLQKQELRNKRNITDVQNEIDLLRHLDHP